MKIAIISDIHSNFAALNALREDGYDEIWCLGDLVDYGPAPEQVTHWIKENAKICVRGNHDHAVGFNVDPQCSLPFRKLAAVTRHYTQDVVTDDELEYLRSLPIQHEVERGGAGFYLVHATPTNPLFGYCPEESERWQQEISWIDRDVLLVGHTHKPFVRRVGKTTIINPGSLGQPKTGRPFACYAVWEDGEVELKEYPYCVEDTIRDIHSMPISAEDQEALISVLMTGSLPSALSQIDTPANSIDKIR